MKGNNKYLALAVLILLSNAVNAQSTGDAVLQQQFADYRENTLQEKIFLHTDKETYLSGEICWFKIYNVDAFFHRPLALSKVAYVEFLDKNNKPVLQGKIALKEGDGNGSLRLPVTLGSGNYKMRAYTNWMKNFSAGYFFEKTVTVVNTRKIYEADTSVTKSSYTVQFFPEGGNIVSNIQCKMAFQVLDQYGKGVDCNGILFNDKMDSIGKFSALKFGIGNFLFKAEKGHSYKALITLPGGKKLLQDLPRAYAEGYVMALSSNDNNQVSVTVQSTDNSSLASTVYLFVHTRGAIKLVSVGQIKDNETIFMVDKNKLGDGISHFTVFNSERRPVCERLYFKFPRNVLQAGITADAQEYDLRKKIGLQLHVADPEGKPVAARMSMSVYRIDSLQTGMQTDINSYLWLNSDLEGHVESPGYYFTGDESAEAAMDNLMLTHGWRRFRWEDVQQNKKPVFEFAPEFVGHVIRGRITKQGTGAPAGNTAAFLSVPGTRTQFRTAMSDKSGFIKFDLKDAYNDGEIIVQTDTREDSSNSIEIFNPFSTKFSTKPVYPFALNVFNSGDLQNHHVAVQVQNVFNDKKFRQFLFPPVDTSAFYINPDVSYQLDNYVRFTTMEEVLREYVAPVNVRKRNGRFHLPTMDESRRTFFDLDPLVLLDAVPVFNLDKIVNYDPLKVKKIDVISRMYFFNNMAFEGVVNLTTYNGNMPGFELDPHATVIDYEGLQLQREFYSPVYETKIQSENRLPDFRNVLYWSPDLRTNATGKAAVGFYSSDLPGKYEVVLQGITASGQSISKKIQFQVKEPASVTRK